MFAQYPSNDRWWSRLVFPDSQPLYTTASIVIGLLHSLPLNLKNHRLHFPEPMTLIFPWNETLIAVSDCSLLNEQSWKTTKLKNSVCHQFKYIIFKSIINNHWIQFLHDNKNHHSGLWFVVCVICRIRSQRRITQTNALIILDVAKWMEQLFY